MDESRPVRHETLVVVLGDGMENSRRIYSTLLAYWLPSKALTPPQRGGPGLLKSSLNIPAREGEVPLRFVIKARMHRMFIVTPVSIWNPKYKTKNSRKS